MLSVGLLWNAFPGTSRTVPESGVVMEEVGRGSALEEAGLRAGDILLSWERWPHPPANPEADRGEIASLFDWFWLVVEQAPRGAVVLRGERQGEPANFRVLPGEWRAKARPRLPEAPLADYVKGRELVADGQLDEADGAWAELADAAEKTGDWRIGSGLCLRMGEAWTEARAWDKAHAAFLRALEKARDPLARAAIREAMGRVRQGQSDFAAAEAAYSAALAIREVLDPGSLHVARTWSDLGSVAWHRGELDLAAARFERALAIRETSAPESLETASSLNRVGAIAFGRGRIRLAVDYFEQALAIRREVAPGSLLVAASLDNLGGAAWTRGDLARAADYLEAGLAIRLKLAPDSLDVASSLNNLGLLVQARGDLARAAQSYERALAIRQRLAPGSLEVAQTLNNLGNVAQARGDLARAAESHERSLAIRRKLAPESLDVAASLNNLGIVAQARGDPALAVEYLERALAIQAKLAPESLDVARSLTNLGTAARAGGDPDRAAVYFERALAIEHELAPESLAVAASLSSLGRVAQDRGLPDRAAGHFERALAIQSKLAPESLDFAMSLNILGSIAMERGDPARAADLYERALAIRRKLAPESLQTAETLNGLGRVAAARGDSKLAADYFGRSIENLEGQLGKLGGSPETKGGFLALHRGWYRDAVELFLQMNSHEQAFAILERSRARGFLAMLAERDLVFSGDLREELERKRRQIGVAHDRTFRQLSDPSLEKDEEKIAALHGELAGLKRKRDAIVAEIRRASPRFAALHYPKPLALRGAREALDPGTVMLSYSVGGERTDLFVVTREEGLEVHPLPIGREELKADVARLRDLIQAPLWSRRKPHFVELSLRLYKTLVEPAAGSVAMSDRILIVADGPLHLLPWSALLRPTAQDTLEAGRSGEYLVEWKPLHSVLSATVYAELKQARRPGPEPGTGVLLAAFGDPSYPRALAGEDPGNIADARVRSAVQRGLFDWQPLPFSRQEVERITELYPSPSTQVYLAENATEERAKAIGRGTRILHFAVHGHPDDLFPLNSGLALTIPEGFPEDRDNGLLQVWEIFERVRLDADLVVLSACESALGEEQGGEGLIGLTRAFQYAGARSVAATLWSVGDRLTAELMVRFYRHLRAGEPQDAALRAAQLELIRGPIPVANQKGKLVEVDASAPYFWAAFQIFGDWR